MRIQVSKKFRIVDKQKLLKMQQDMEKKYGLRPHKKIKTEYFDILPYEDTEQLSINHSPSISELKRKENKEKMIKKLSPNLCCNRCSFSEVIDIHHILPRAYGGTDEEKNLIILCPNCHAMFHRGLISTEELLKIKNKEQ